MFLTKQHHIAVISSDYAKAKEFYIDKLGFELCREVYRPAQDDYLRMLRKGDTVLELFIRPDAPQRVNNPEAMGLRHLAFRVDDFEAAHAKHAEMGCICYENTAMGLYFNTDPDEYWLEILPARR